MRSLHIRSALMLRLSVGALSAGAPGLAAQAQPAAAPGQPSSPPSGGPDAAGGGTTVPSIAAVIAATPKNLPRARGPALRSAVDAALAAESACANKGAKISVLIADSAGETVVLVSGDGAGVRSQLIARTKVNIVAKYGMASADVVKKAETDPDLNKAAAADPNIGMLRAGGIPVMRGGQRIAIVGVSGGSLASGDLTLDEKCALVAVKRLQTATSR